MPGKHSAAAQSRAAARTRESEALELRKAGATLDVIAKQVGYHDATGARRAILRAMDRLTTEPARELRELETLRLDDLYRRTMQIAVRPHYLYQAGKIVLDNMGRPVEDDGPRLKALDALRRISESKRRLWGLDQPVLVEVTDASSDVNVVASKLVERFREMRAVSAGAGGGEDGRGVIDVEGRANELDGGERGGDSGGGAERGVLVGGGRSSVGGAAEGGPGGQAAQGEAGGDV